MEKVLRRFSTFDLLIIALLSACGIATKPFVRMLAQILAGTLIPAGAVAGVFYMLWIVLACSITRKRGTAILVGIVQAVLVVIFDMLGNKGLGNLLIYIMPGITLELVMFIFPKYVSSVFSGLVAGLTANVTGAFLMGVVFMHLPLIPLGISLGLAAISGGVGGVIGFKVYDVIKQLNKVKADS